MKDIKMPNLKIGDKIAELPIVQGGMSVGISLSGLASAVADQGGIGVIGAAGLGLLKDKNPDDYSKGNEVALREEIRKAREMSDGLIGVNIMMALSDYDSLIMASIDEGVDFIFIGAGVLLRAPDTMDMKLVKESPTKIVPIVSSARGAMVIFKFWSRNYDYVPDAVVVEGPMAGGHIGYCEEEVDDPDYSLESIVPQVIDIITPYEEQFNKKIPVIAAGGIYNGADILRLLNLGASGVQMGSRFVGTKECDASDEFKKAYIEAEKEDIVLIRSPVGMPGRAIKNQFLMDVSSGKKIPFACPWKCLRTCDYKASPYCIAIALTNAKLGKLKQGFAFAGANAYRVKEIITVKELFENLIAEYEEAVKKLKATPSSG